MTSTDRATAAGGPSTRNWRVGRGQICRTAARMQNGKAWVAAGVSSGPSANPPWLTHELPAADLMLSCPSVRGQGFAGC